MRAELGSLFHHPETTTLKDFACDFILFGAVTSDVVHWQSTENWITVLMKQTSRRCSLDQLEKFNCAVCKPVSRTLQYMILRYNLLFYSYLGKTSEKCLIRISVND